MIRKIHSVQEYLTEIELLQNIYLLNSFDNKSTDNELILNIYKKCCDSEEFKVSFIKLMQYIMDLISRTNEQKINLKVEDAIDILELIYKDDEKVFIKSIIQHIFDKDIVNLKQTEQLEYFFRGQSNTEYCLTPSIFRGLLENESNIVNDTLSDRVDEFKDCTTMFEKLVKMQHYGIPTRTLDITGNALSALYFACEPEASEYKFKDEYKSKNNDGAVFLFTARKKHVAYPDSDKVRILSNLTRLKNFKYCKNQVNGRSTYTNIYNNCIIHFYQYLNCIIFGDNCSPIDKDLINKIDIEIVNQNLNFTSVENYVSFIDKLITKYTDKTDELHVYHQNVKETINHIADTYTDKSKEKKDIKKD